MSISNLFEPNNYNLNCGSVTFGSQDNGATGATGAGPQNAFQAYRQQSLSFGATGAISLGATGVVGLYRQLDRSYVMSVAGVGATGSNVSGPITLSPALPTNIWPGAPYNFPIWVQDSGSTTPVAGNCSIGTNGVITIYKNYNTNFTAANTGIVGFPTFSVAFASYIT